MSLQIISDYFSFFMFNMIDNKLNVRIIFFPIVMKVGHIRQIVKHNCNVEI